MRKAKESKEDAEKRLKESGAPARALLALLEEFRSSVLLAEKIGVNRSVIYMWKRNGKVSMRGATLLAEKLGRTKEEFRPDLKPEDWARDFPGPVPGQPAANATDDAKLLVSAAQKFGGTAALCAKLGITIQTFHMWKSRGKIPNRRFAGVQELAQQ